MSKVSPKGQVTIPKDIREKLGLHPGDEVEFEEIDDGYVLIQKSGENPFEKWRGVADTDKSVRERMEELRGSR